ncbi:MAG TPA: hypothetical protein VKS60_18735 [Stellaceae bacterium]|nr:hypothetical protein [Stellaceae bacterium]
MDASSSDSTAAASAPALAIARLLAEQNFALAVPAGIGAAILGAVLWAAVVYVTDMEIGLIAVAVGAMVGYAVRVAGKGVQPRFGILGAVCAAFGWALGTLLCDVAFVAHSKGLPMLDILAALNVERVERLVGIGFQPFDLVFLAIAVYEGYKFSFRARLKRR